MHANSEFSKWCDPSGWGQDDNILEEKGIYLAKATVTHTRANTGSVLSGLHNHTGGYIIMFPRRVMDEILKDKFNVKQRERQRERNNCITFN